MVTRTILALVAVDELGYCALGLVSAVACVAARASGAPGVYSYRALAFRPFTLGTRLVRRTHRALTLHNIALRRAVLAPPPRATNRALRVRAAVANLGRAVTGRTLLARRARALTLHSCLVGWSGCPELAAGAS